MTRRAPQPFGLELWDRIERLLERIANDEDDPDELMAEIRKVRMQMVAENTRRAEGILRG